MSVLTAFFKGSDTRFGIFYPVHYLVAIFPGAETARRAARNLDRDGFDDEDLISVPGAEVIRFAEEHLKMTSLWALLMQKLSEIFATEEIYTQHDLRLAEHGAAFLAVYCPTQGRKREAWRILHDTCPIVARYYALDGIEHLAGEV